jgi:hypothetical protein
VDPWEEPIPGEEGERREGRERGGSDRDQDMGSESVSPYYHVTLGNCMTSLGLSLP